MREELTIEKKGHPKGLYLLFFTEMWERFSYYGMRGILVLYLTKSFVEGGLSFSESTASMIYGIFTGFVYFTPLIGGWLADRYIGQRHSITIGGITMMLGQFILFLFNTRFGLWTGLLLLIIGNGFFKPNISTIVGDLYKKGDPKRDSAFSIFYMGINIGAFFAPLIVGFLYNNLFAISDASGKILTYGYKYGFLASGIGMLLGQVIYNSLSNKYLGNLGMKPAGAKGATKQDDEGNIIQTDAPLSKEEKQRVSAVFVYFFFAIFFFAGYEQAGNSFTLFTENHINRTIGNFIIPTAWFQSVNPIFIVVLTPIYAALWTSKLGKKMTTPIKMGLGLILLGLGFIFISTAAAQVGEDPLSSVKASMLWIIFTYFVHTLGELCLSPVGLSVTTKLAPPKLASLLMGVWLLSSFFGNLLAGWISSITSTMGAHEIYSCIALGGIVCGLAMLLLNKGLLRIMHGVR